jgi:hypothetical protein
LVHRYRSDDPDTLPRLFSVWDFEYEGKFTCGFSIPGSEAEYCSPVEIRKRERQLEVERLELEHHDGVHIAAQLGISRATVCRDLQAIRAAKEATAASEKVTRDEVRARTIWFDGDDEGPTSPPPLRLARPQRNREIVKSSTR